MDDSSRKRIIKEDGNQKPKLKGILKAPKDIMGDRKSGQAQKKSLKFNINQDFGSNKIEHTQKNKRYKP